MAIDLEGRSPARLQHIRVVAAQPGLGTSRLTLQASYSAWAEHDETRAITYELTGGRVAARAGDGGTSFYLGALVVEGGRPVRQRANPSPHGDSWDLALELPSAKIAAVERLRAGGDFVFEVTLVGSTWLGEKRETGSGQTRIEVTQSEWVAWLRSMGLQHTLLLEVPIVIEPLNTELRAVGALLEDARHQLLAGRHREVFDSCRRALEALGLLAGDGTGTSNDLRAMLETPAALTKEQRLMVLRRAGFVMASLAAHAKDDVSLRTNWDRSDAVAMFTVTVGLVQWAAGALPAP